MDDQQHALSALLRTEAIVEAAGSGSGSDWPAPSVWLWLGVLVAAFNPFRVMPGVPRDGRSRQSVVQVAAVGAAAGAVLTLVLSLASGPLLDVLDVSRPALRIAAGVVAALAGVVAVFRSPPPADPALPGWRAALVPVAIPLTASPALILLALSAHADRGAGVVAAAVAAGAVALVALVRFVSTGGTSGRVLAWVARLSGAALIAGSLLLVIDGILDV
jgi:small neutral amino acid transporter SnatA (MarC family)